MRGKACMAVLLLMMVPGALATYTFSDPEGDVTRGSDTYSGPGAQTVDVLSAGVDEEQGVLVFHLGLADLDGLEDELAEEGFHAQYALSFTVDRTDRVYSVRAMYGGSAYTGSDGGWKWQIHDHEPDEWPSAHGFVDGDTLIWRVPAGDLGMRPGDTMSGWGVQTWNSYAEQEQYGDRADGDGSTRINDAADEDPEAPAPGIGSALSIAALVGLAWSRRRSGV